MSKTKKFSSEEKVKILREHLENKVAISDLAELYSLSPKIIYMWKKQLFENASSLFERKQNTQSTLSQDKSKIDELESALAQRENLISELATELVSIKKKENGVISKTNGNENVENSWHK